MRKPVVDYSSLRFSNIISPQYSHLLLLLGWIVYFILYFLTETFIPVEHCYIMHSSLDDMIPFCEIFVIPYVFWYLLIVGSLGYFLLYNVDSFKKLQIFIIITQAVAMAIYIAFPNMQDLRPEFFPRDNIFSRAVDVIYSVDTNTNVCPSLHVAYSLGIASVWLKEKDGSFVEFSLIESRFLDMSLDNVQELFRKQKELVQESTRENYQAKIELMSFIETVAAKPTTEVQLKGSRTARKKEIRKRHKDVGEFMDE